MAPLNITHRDTASGPVLQVVGELDYDQAPLLRSRLQDLVLTAEQRLVIDLSALEFCDSSGIAALLTARRRAQEAGADLALAALPANLLRILHVVGLDEVFTVLPSADAL